MRFNVETIATAAFAVLLMPAFLVHAEEGANAPAGTGSRSADSLPSSSSEPATPPPAAAATTMDAPTASPVGSDYGTPKVEWFLGYSYLRAVPADDANRLRWLNGGSTSLAYNFTRHLGLVGDFGVFNNSELRIAGARASYVVQSQGKVYTYLIGPRLSFRGRRRVTPFIQALFGGVQATEAPRYSGCSGAGCTPLPSETSFALTAGGGVDIRINHHLSFRAIQAEYMMTRFENLSTGQNASQSDMRLSTGVVLRFGGHPPLQLPASVLTYSCSVSPAAVFPGERAAVTGAAVELNPAKTAVYTWSVDGGTVTGTGNSAAIDTAGIAPGSYTVKGHVSEGAKPSENADCTAVYAVRGFEPPTVSCSANPASVLPGDSSTITAIGVSPQSLPLTYSYSSTSGVVSGNGTTATLATAGVAPGTITVSCNVADSKGQMASATTSVSVVSAALAAAPTTSELCAIQFERDARRPARVDNEAKACLDGIALTLQRTSDAKIALVGNASQGEKGGGKLAAQRAVNTKAYLVGEKGIDSSRIVVYSGAQNAKTVTTTLIPAGATLDTGAYMPVH